MAVAVTEEVATVKFAVVAPAPTVTLAGTDAAAWLLDSVTVAPPAGAAPLNVTVPVEELLPTTLVGVSDINESVKGGGVPVGVTVRVAVPTTPPYVAEIVAAVAAATDVVVTVKLAVVAPAPTVTLAGTVAAALLLDRVTAAPPDGAGALKVTVAVEELPPPIFAGLSDTAESLTPVEGFTVRVALRVVPFNEAVIVTVLVAITVPVFIVNVVL